MIYGHALLNADVDGSQGPYPLVVYSHGFGVNAAWTHTILGHYASYGFIVLAPEHIEQFDPAWGDLWKASIDRPRDIKQTLRRRLG
jgi:predicted dienelactone hydrolase